MKKIVYVIIAGPILTFMALTFTAQESPALLTKDCNVCHVSQEGGPVKKTLTELCVHCHRERIPFEHTVDVVPKYPVPPTYPLTKDGKLTCITCHDQHSQEPMMLRLQPVIALCNECHKK